MVTLPPDEYLVNYFDKCRRICSDRKDMAMHDNFLRAMCAALGEPWDYEDLRAFLFSLDGNKTDVKKAQEWVLSEPVANVARKFYGVVIDKNVKSWKELKDNDNS